MSKSRFSACCHCHDIHRFRQARRHIDDSDEIGKKIPKNTENTNFTHPIHPKPQSLASPLSIQWAFRRCHTGLRQRKRHRSTCLNAIGRNCARLCANQTTYCQWPSPTNAFGGQGLVQEHVWLHRVQCSEHHQKRAWNTTSTSIWITPQALRCVSVISSTSHVGIEHHSIHW